jgi:hypothetical protein
MDYIEGSRKRVLLAIVGAAVGFVFVASAITACGEPLPRGYGSLDVTPAMIGRAMDRKHHSLDCAIYEDGSWG